MTKAIYLAGPFFNPLQVALLEKIEKICEQAHVSCFSPRKFLVLPPRASWDVRREVFVDNLKKIEMSDLVFACLDNPEADGTPRPPDTGTLWEMGYAYAVGRPVVAFLEEGDRMNVMLAQGCAGFLKSFGDVLKFLGGKYLGKLGGGSEFDFDWEVAQTWRKDIF